MEKLRIFEKEIENLCLRFDLSHEIFSNFNSNYADNNLYGMGKNNWNLVGRIKSEIKEKKKKEKRKKEEKKEPKKRIIKRNK